MPRLPDIPINDWVEDQATRFREQTESFFPSLEFALGTRVAQSEIPPDFDAPGGMDQWEEAERKNLEEQYRLQQEAAEERQRQEREQLAEQYRQQQAASEEAARQQQAENEAAVMEQIRGLGIRTPSEAFAQLTPGNVGDSLSSSEALTPPAPSTPPPSPPMSDADQFNQFATGLQSSTFPTPPDPAQQPPPDDTESIQPDHTSSTGLLDQIGSAVSSGYRTAVRGGMPDVVDIAQRGEQGARYLAENYGIGRLERESNRLGELQDRAYANVDPITRIKEVAAGRTPGEDSGLTPEERTEYEELTRSQNDLIAGATNPNPGGLADDAVNAIKTLIKHGVADDIVLAMERNMAEHADMPLSAVQKLTRVASEAVGDITEPLADASRAETRAVASDLPTAGSPALTADELPPAARVSALDELASPSFGNYAPTRRTLDESVRGFGTLPESLEGGGTGGMARATEQEIREAVGPATQPFTFEQRSQMVADMIQAEPDAVSRVLRGALEIDPRRAGAEQELLKQNVRLLGDQWDEARQLFFQSQQDIASHVARFGKGAEVPTELAEEAAYAATEFKRLTNDLSIAVKGQSLSAKAASQVLNAQRSGRLGAYALEEAGRIEQVATTAGEAAKVAEKARNGGALSEGELQSLRELEAQLSNARTRKAVSGEGRAAREVDKLTDTSGSGGGTRRPRTTTTPPAPKEETLAERLGRLKREQGRLESANAPEAELGSIRDEIEQVIIEMREQAVPLIEQRLARKAEKQLSAEEMERIVNQTIGRRTQSAIQREELRRQQGLTGDENAINRGVQKGIDQYYRKAKTDIEKEFRKLLTSNLKLDASIQAQVNRRIDGMLAAERRANVRAEIKDMAAQAQVWAKRIRDMPDQPGLREEFDAILGQMREHSNVGERVAADLQERLGVNLEEDTVNRMFREAKQGTQAINDARLSAVRQQIKDVLENRHGPDRTARIASLYDDLKEINFAGIKLASEHRRKIFESGIMKAGLDAGETPKSVLVDMMLAARSDQPETLRPLLETLSRPTLWRQWREISFINMLSNPMTLATNITSTVANAVTRLAIDNPLQFIGSLGQTRGQIAALEGTFASRTVGQAAKRAWQIERTGVNPERLDQALVAGEIGHLGQEMLPQSLGKIGLGKVGVLMHMISTRPLEASDAFMAHMMQAGAARQLAQQKADSLIKVKDPALSIMKIAGSSAPPREQAAEYILQNIWDFPDVLKGAGKAADYTLFRGRDVSTNRAIAKFEQGLRQMMGAKEVGGLGDATGLEKAVSGIVDFVVPFWNVPYNFTKQGLAKVAALPLEGTRLAQATARGDREAMGEHFAKAVHGSGLMVGAWWLATGDNLTASGPQDAGDRRVWLTDHRPYSVRVPGTNQWISYQGTPWAIPFATMAGATENLKFKQKADPTMSETDKYIAGGFGALSGAAEGAMSNSLLDAAVNNFQFLTGQSAGETNIAIGATGLATRYLSPLPSGLLKFLADISDSVERDPGKPRNFSEIPQNVEDRIKARTPGLRDDLPERRNAYGEVEPNRRSWQVSGPAALFPTYRGPAGHEGDPITRQLEKGSIGIPNAPEEVTLSAEARTTMPLTIREQQEFQRIFGERYRAILEKQGAGERPMTDYRLTNLRDLARKQAVAAIIRSVPVEERRRRMQRKPREWVPVP